MQYLTIVSLVATFTLGYGITCQTCDSPITCANPIPEYCPPRTSCYTISERGQVIYKGCTSGCSVLPAAKHHARECKTCTYDNCNANHHVVSSHTFDLSHKYHNNKHHQPPHDPLGPRRPRELGSGVAPENRNTTEIGRDSIVFKGTLKLGENGEYYIPSVKGPKIGSGVQADSVQSDEDSGEIQLESSSHNIGSGAAVDQPSIGRGVYKKRRSLGHGVRPNGHHQPPRPPHHNQPHIGSGVSGPYHGPQHQRHQPHHGGRHPHRNRRSGHDIHNPIGSGAGVQQNHNSRIGDGTVPFQHHSHQSGYGDIGHGVRPKAASYTSLMTFPIMMIIIRILA